MRQKPTAGAPAADLATGGGRVAGVYHAADNTLVTAGAHGAVSLWDLRAIGAGPRSAVGIGGGGVTCFAASPLGDVVAVATPGRVATVDIGSGAMSVVDAAPKAAVASVRVNAATGEVVTGGADGSIRAYRQRRS
jgi:hypothetical protein